MSLSTRSLPGRQTALASPPEAMAGGSAIPWLTVGLLAALMAYADGFWLVSLRGAIGAIERTQQPFHTWLRDSTLLLPLFLLVVLAALRFGRRRFGSALRGWRAVVTTAVLIAAAGTVLGTVAVAASTTYDYHLQSKQLDVIHAAHSTQPAGVGHVHATTSPDGCDTPCQNRRAMVEADVRALRNAAGVLAATNLLLVGWVIALRGGRLVPVKATRH